MRRPRHPTAETRSCGPRVGHSAVTPAAGGGHTVTQSRGGHTLVTRDMEMEMEHYYEDSHLLESATPYTDAIRVSHFVNICLLTSDLKAEKII